MSGIKKGEVVNLLAQGEQLKRDIYRNLNNRIENDIRNNQNLMKELNAIKTNINKISVTISEEIKNDEDRKELQKIIRKIDLEKEKVNSIYLSNFENLMEQKKKLEQNMRNLDRDMTSISNMLNNSPAPYDNLYSQANSVNRLYQSNKNKLNDVGEKIYQETINNTLTTNSLKSSERNIKKWKEEFDIKSKNIINEDKVEYINELFRSINEENALKFMKNEFEILRNDTKGINITNIEAKFENLKNNITSFMEKLDAKYNRYLEKKSLAEKKLEGYKELEKNFKLPDIEEYIQNKTVYLDMYEFAKKYNVSNTSEQEYLKNLKAAERLLEKEDFDLAISVVEEGRKNLVIEQNILTDEFERIISQVEYTKKILLAGDELGYNLETELIGNGIEEGYSVKLTMGDEIIEFEPTIDSEGNSFLHIDHTESVSGDCANSIQNICKSLQRNGLVITDVLKNDRSVLYGNKKSGQTITKKNITSTK